MKPPSEVRAELRATVDERTWVDAREEWIREQALAKAEREIEDERRAREAA